MVGKAAGWANPVGESPLQLRRLNIGPRLTFCFLLIVLVLLLANGVLVWQFHQSRTQAYRLSGVDQELIAVLQAHTSLMSFYERLDLLAQSENTDELAREVDDLRNALLQDSRRTRNALSHLPLEVQLDPALRPTLWTIEGALPSELEAITVLAKSRDWEAVRLRLANQIRPLEARSSALVANIDREVGEQRAQALLNIGRAQRRILLIVPITGSFTLLFAAFLGLFITRSITLPLRQLMEGSAALARGDFGHRVPAEGNDEFARLGDVFNNMIVRLQELYRELQIRESYLAEAQKLSQTGSFGWRPTSGEIVWSEETYRIFALDRTTKPTGELVLLRTHPEDRHSVQELIDRATREAKDWDLEHRIVLPDGAVKHLHVVAHAAHDEFTRGTEYVGAVMDITERKQAEEALRRSERQLRAVIETIPAMAWTASPDGSNDFANGKWLEFTGMTLGDTSGDGWKSAIHPSDLEAHWKLWSESLTTGRPFENEARLRGAEHGEYRWFLFRAVPLRDEFGQIVKWYGTGTDIEDRKRAEHTLLVSEARFAEAQRLGHTGSWVWNRVTNHTYWSEETFRIYGFPLETTPSRDLFQQQVHPDDLAIVEAAGDLLLTKGCAAYDFRLLLPDNSLKYIHSVAQAVKDVNGQVIEFQGTAIDVTELRRAEQELQQLVDFVPQLIAMLGPDGRVVHANRVAQEYTGLTLDEYRSVDVVSRVIHPDDAERMRSILNHALSRSDPFEIEARLLGKDGIYRWFLFRYNPLLDQQRVRRWYASATEIESRKQKEERVRKENVFLEDRTRIAQELHDTLLQSFLGASMQLGAAMTSLPSDSLIKPKLDGILELMEQGIEDGRRAIEGLRSPDSGTLDLGLALSGIQRELAVPPDVEFRFNVGGRQQPIQPPIRQEIYRIGREALINAFRHSGAKRVELDLEYTDSKVRMRVRDNGCGIYPQVLNTGREGHWGLQGMRERARRLGAHLVLWSLPGTGTEIELLVPAATAYGLEATEQKPSGFVDLPASTPEEL